MSKRFSIRTQGSPLKSSFNTLEDAYNAALELAQNVGKDVAVIEHEGDNTRLVKKVILRG